MALVILFQPIETFEQFDCLTWEKHYNILMSNVNKEILIKANEAITNGDNEGFLKYCTEDTEWHFVGDQILRGKDAVRSWMKKNYVEPPKFNVENLVSEGDFVIAMGSIAVKNESGQITSNSYCDVWKFRDNKIDKLKAFVIEDI